MKNAIRNIHIDQLYTQDEFLSFCNDDHNSNYGKKLGVKITPEFLEACEKDEFIIPLLTQNQSKYYSPFQIFLVTELCHNNIDKDGLLRDPETDLSYQKEHKTRYINWGGNSAFNINNRKTERNIKYKILNHFTLMCDVNNFVKCLHTFGVVSRGDEHWDYDKRRRYQHAPEIQFDFKNENDIKNILKKYKLTIDKLKTLLKVIGNFALHIDPMEQWFAYIHKHPVLRKDEFKGLANVAQELYNFCDIIKNMIEVAEQKQLPPFVEFIKSDFIYTNRDKINSYAEGDDILAIKKSLSDITYWIKKNKKYINSLFTKHPEWKSIDFDSLIKELQEKVNDFHNRYGDIRYVGNLRTIHPSSIAIENLDPITKQYVDYFVKNDIPDEEYEMQDLAMHISQAIGHRLSDLKREVFSLANNIARMLENDVPRIEQEKYASVGPIQEKYTQINKNSTKDPGLLSVLFWREFLPKEQAKFQKELDTIEKFKSELYTIAKETGLVFCAKCRKKYVVVHQLHYDEKLSNEAICDDCIDTKDLQSIKSGEWRCEHENSKGQICNALLYKFAHNNIMNTNLMNNSNATITLNFGQMDIHVKCKDCKNISVKSIDWGWLE